MKYEYEALWYEGQTEKEAMQHDPHFISFASRKQAMAYYEKHKNDNNKFGWWVTKRDAEDGYVIEDIIY